MARGIEHKDVGNELTKEEWLHGAHYFMSGTSFPDSPSEGDVFYRLDEHCLYIYLGEPLGWKPLGPYAVYG